MMKSTVSVPVILILAALAAGPLRSQAPWSSWRGPDQTGASRETDLPDAVDLGAGAGWTYELAGRGTPVVAGGRVYAFGYEGEREALQEVLVCLDEETGQKIWEHRFTDFLTDIIYYRFSIGSPTVDPGTGRVYLLSSAGLLSCFSRDGDLLWEHCLLSEYGRLTFPNGRTGSPLVDGDLVIVHVIASGWGADAPARDRFFAFDKTTGDSAWTSTPGGPPNDSSFSFPVVATEDGRRVLYAGLGGGNLVCVDVRTGDPIWRYRMAVGGMNSSALLFGDTVIAIHGKENLDSSALGRMIAVRRGARPEPGQDAVTLDKSAEVWRNDLVAFTSSPVLVGDRVYQTNMTGDLCCVDANDGRVLWHEKLGPDQLHASPAAGDGKLYVPLTNGSFFVIRPSDEGAGILQQLQLDGDCLGAPAIANGRIYVHTTQRLYAMAAAEGAPVRLQVRPADAVVSPGEEVAFRVTALDAHGRVVRGAKLDVQWGGLPAGGAMAAGRTVFAIAADALPSASEITARSGELTGRARLRIVPGIPSVETFEGVTLKPDPKQDGLLVASPPAYWVGAKLKWEVLELDGGKVLGKTLDIPLFQRTMSMIGHPAMSGYTVQADIYSDGNRRSMSTAGLVNQRYLIRLKGNHQELEVSSNMELLNVSVPYEWKPKTWHTLKTRVDMGPDGSAVIRAKAWPRGTPEPDAWTIEVPHLHALTSGSPGIYGFTPQSRFRVYLDNISVTKND